MPDADFFARWGLFVRRGFLARDACERLIEEIRRARQEPARVYRQTVASQIDPGARKTASADVSAEASAALGRALEDVRPDLARHFHVELRACQPIDFLVYRPGDFFEAHADGGAASSSETPHVAARRVSAVVFLNDAAGAAPAPAGRFSGGALTFKLMDDPRASHAGFPLDAEAGLLVAFPAELVHEVGTVTSGERFTAVAFFE
jgi:predicted 2-oxoglutarate/Fe(II)-dependent dioxygenase YbiX